MTRIFLSGLIAAVTVSMAALPADAKSKRGKYANTGRSYERVANSDENPDSAICIRARGQDPGGNYRHYPCWAQAALSGAPRR